MKNNFKKLIEGETQDLNSEYDIKSVMHYDGLSFTKNFKPTMTYKGTQVILFSFYAS